MSTSDLLRTFTAVTGDNVDPNIVPRVEDVGNIIRLLVDHINFIERLEPGEAMTFSIHKRVPLVEVRRTLPHGHTWRVNGKYVGDGRWAAMVYMQIVFTSLGLDSGTSPSLYYNNDGTETETGGTSYATNQEAN